MNALKSSLMKRASSGLARLQSLFPNFLSNSVAGPGAFVTARRDNKNTANWETSNGSADSDTLFDQATIRNQARDLDRNNPIAGGAINNAATNIIGEGLRARSRINYEYLGITYEQAQALQRKIDFFFHAWAMSMNADVTRTQNFYELQNLILRNYLVSGDVGVLRRYRKVPGAKLGTSLQIIESDRISNPIGIVSSTIRGGIETDEFGAMSAAWISKFHPGDSILSSLNMRPQDWTRVPAYDENGERLFLHIFRRTRPDQSRGISYLAPIIEPLKQLGRYTEAEITAAVVSACFSVFIKSEGDSGLNSSLTAGSLPGMVNYGQGHLTPPGTGITKLQSGMIADLAPGESIEIADPKRPNTAFDPFIQAVIRQIGMSLEQPYETLLKHYTSSFTAARAALNDLWKFIKERRAFAISHYCNPVREWVISECVMEGLIDLPGFFEDPFARQAWLNCVWSGPTMGHINPSVEADAEMKWVGMGAKSLGQTAMEQFGNDWEEVADDRERELQRYIKLPVLVNPNLVTQPIDPSKQAPGTTMPVPSDGNDPKNDPNSPENGGDNAS